MRAGRLREQIVIQQRADTVDAIGQPVPGWSTFATVAAEVNYARGREYYAAQQMVAQRPVRFSIRYLPGLTAEHRITWNGDVYAIRYVEDYAARGTEHRVFADTGVAEA